MNKINLSKLFKKAWAIKKENKLNVFSECLKMAWELAKSKPVKKSVKKVDSKTNKANDWFAKMQENLKTAPKKEVAEVQKVTVKSWFISNNVNLTSQEKTAIKFEAYFGKVIKETEKAVQVLFSTDFGNVKLWTPKSCLEIN